MADAAIVGGDVVATNSQEETLGVSIGIPSMLMPTPEVG